MADIKYKPVSQLLFIFLLIFVFGVLGFFTYLMRLIRRGPRNMFYRKRRNVRPEVLCNNALGSHEFVMLKKSRMKLHYVISGPKDKPLMLFVHGFPEFWYTWRHQLKEFSKDYRVCAVDMRGYGESDKPTRISDYHISELTHDLQQLIEQLGFKRCILVAHDWGGLVAWFFTIRYPEMVDRLIVCNCPHPAVFKEQLKSSLHQILMSWYMYFFQLPVLPLLNILGDDLDSIVDIFARAPVGAKQGSFTDEDIEAFKYNVAEYDDLLGPINYYRALIRYDTPEWAQGMGEIKITAHTLMVWGTGDAALGREMADMSGRHVEDYTLKWVDGASHWVQQEEPEIVNQHIREFLRRK